MTPLDGLGVATMFATDSDLEVRTGCTAINDSHFHQLTYTFPVDRLEWVLGQDFLFDICDQKVSLSIIPRIAKSHLGEVVGAKREELGKFSNFGRCNCGTWNFDHRSELVAEVDFLLIHHSLGYPFQPGLDPFELAKRAG